MSGSSQTTSGNSASADEKRRAIFAVLNGLRSDSALLDKWMSYEQLLGTPEDSTHSLGPRAFSDLFRAPFVAECTSTIANLSMRASRTLNELRSVDGGMTQ